MSNDSIPKTITVAVLLCVVCSVLVSTAAVKLKPLQERNKALYTKKNILLAAGLMEEGKDVEELFKQIKVKIVDLASGEYDEKIDPQKYDQKVAAKDSAMSVMIPGAKDIAKIRRRALKIPVYLVQKGDRTETYILPIHGKGLWSTMYGFLALKGDLNTVQGITFYDHGETPGLGGEIDNPLWQKQWVGKKLFDENWILRFDVLKGKVNQNKPAAIHQVDGLSGATLTTVGVKNMVRYWLDDHGYGKFLARTRI